MSAPFRYSHRDVTRLDLRHIYSGSLQPTNYRIQPLDDHPGINYLDRLHEIMTRKTVSKRPGKCYEYVREYGVVLPRAPAFRRLSKSEVNNVVYRLCNPTDRIMNTTTIKEMRMISSAPAGGTRASARLAQHDPNGRHTQLSQKYINGIVNRLYHSKTHSTGLRQREKVVMFPRSTTPVPSAVNKYVPDKNEN